MVLLVREEPYTTPDSTSEVPAKGNCREASTRRLGSLVVVEDSEHAAKLNQSEKSFCDNPSHVLLKMTGALGPRAFKYPFAETLTK